MRIVEIENFEENIMQALTLWPEWAWAILFLGKPMENRGWKSDALLGQRFAIHAGASIGGRKGKVALDEAIEAVTMTAQHDGWDSEWLTEDGFRINSSNLWRGKESVQLDAFIQTSAIVCTAVLDRFEENTGQTPPPWAHPDSKYWWHLRDIEVLAEPVPCGGHQQLWELPADLERAVLRQQGVSGRLLASIQTSRGELADLASACDAQGLPDVGLELRRSSMRIGDAAGST